MQVELRQLQRNVGITFVFVTHDQEEALTLSDRIAVMSAGKVLQIARSDDLYEKPNCREVAEFIGNMNLFEGKIATLGKGSVTVDTAAGQLTAQADIQFAPGTTVYIAVRPEKMALSTTKPERGVNALKGRIIAETYLGDRRQYFLSTAAQAKPVTVSQQISGTEAKAPSEGDVWITWSPALARLLAT
jgi:ABC-type Fe3+/spermidine/putrescine transport system ATPase subunit